MKVRPKMTAEELWELPEKPGTRYELVDGELVELPGAGVLHTLIVGLVYKLIDAFATERDLGLAFPDGMGYVIRQNPDLLRIPDVSFVSWGRVPEEGVPEGFWYMAPDLAVEVVSPNDRADDVHEKVREYLQTGSKAVWVMWPKQRSVTTYTPDGVARELGPEEELDGGDALAGFRMRVGGLFEVRKER